MALEETVVGKTCPFCQTPIKPGSEIVICPECKMPHHRDCWEQNHGCTTFGCSRNAGANPAGQTGGMGQVASPAEVRSSLPAPTCYRHPNRETHLSCGRCGRPLCPDCMIHGPVGIRCAECLRPPRADVQLAAPERINTALVVALVQAMVWVGAIVLLEWMLHDPEQLSIPMPNLLLSGVAGGVVGWSIWRICGRSSNRKTGMMALWIGIAIPVLSTLSLLPFWIILLPFLSAKFLLLLAARELAAMAICALFCWLLATRRR